MGKCCTLREAFGLSLSVLFVVLLFLWGLYQPPPVSHLRYANWSPNVGGKRLKYRLVCNSSGKVVGGIEDDEGWFDRNGYKETEIDEPGWQRVASIEIGRERAEEFVVEHHSCG
jgi:hypothetical protein